MLTKKRPDTLPTDLTIKCQGETIKFAVTFNNRTLSELQEVLDNECTEDAAPAVLFLVKDWETEYELSREGVLEMENDRPGITLAIIAAFHEARGVEKVKNS